MSGLGYAIINENIPFILNNFSKTTIEDNSIKIMDLLWIIMLGAIFLRTCEKNNSELLNPLLLAKSI